MATDPIGDVLLDDGEYFVQEHVNNPPTASNGFLMRRGASSSIEEAECVGGYDLNLDGRWLADIASFCDVATGSDSRLLGHFDSRLDAIWALWKHRHDATTRHSRH
ncbi:hypothetical protein [Paraburkholderia xenovorans]